MYEPQPCFKCGQLGHLKAQCPSRRTPAAQVPEAASADAAAPVEKVKFQTGADGKRRLVMEIPDWSPGEIADAAKWATSIREADPRLGEGQAARERRLRALAAEQAQEARGEREGIAAA
jgi:hypothetical protein